MPPEGTIRTRHCPECEAQTPQGRNNGVGGWLCSKCKMFHPDDIISTLGCVLLVIALFAAIILAAVFRKLDGF